MLLFGEVIIFLLWTLEHMHPAMINVIRNPLNVINQFMVEVNSFFKNKVSFKTFLNRTTYVSNQ